MRRRDKRNLIAAADPVRAEKHCIARQPMGSLPRAGDIVPMAVDRICDRDVQGDRAVTI